MIEEKEMIKLIAIDMDGTLLNDEKKIPKENIQAIKEATQAGIKIVLCTGRPMSGILPYFNELGLTKEEYIIMNNGCSTYSTKDWQLIDSATLTHDELIFLEEVVKEFPNVCLTLTAENTFYAVGEEVPEIVAYDADLVFTKAKSISLDALRNQEEIVFQAMYMGLDADVTVFQEAVEEALISKFSGVRSQDYIYEIMPQGVTKARGLKSLIAKLGLDINQVMAIGDAPNDIELLDLVPNSVAMGNASDEIKSRCKYITVDNNQAGVAKAIYDYALR